MELDGRIVYIEKRLFVCGRILEYSKIEVLKVFSSPFVFLQELRRKKPTANQILCIFSLGTTTSIGSRCRKIYEVEPACRIMGQWSIEVPLLEAL